jgi:hypothetical protein
MRSMCDVAIGDTSSMIGHLLSIGAPVQGGVRMMCAGAVVRWHDVAVETTNS